MRHFFGSIKDMRDIWKTADAFGVNTYALCERMLVQMLYTGAHVGDKIEIFRAYSREMGNEQLRMAFLSQCCYDYVVKEQIMDSFIFRGIMQLYQKDAFMHRVCKMAFLQYYAENRHEQDDRIRRRTGMSRMTGSGRPVVLSCGIFWQSGSSCRCIRTIRVISRRWMNTRTRRSLSTGQNRAVGPSSTT